MANESAFAAASDNIYTSSTLDDIGNPSSSDNAVHTRIYKMGESTITLDEMSLPLTRQESELTEDGERIDYQQYVEGDNSYESNIGKSSNGAGGNQIMDKGTSYPLIRINDHYITSDELVHFMLDNTGFIPLLEITVDVSNDELKKTDQIKEGDICSVFISPGHGMLKSLRCDFLIDEVSTSEMSQNNIHPVQTYVIRGSLYIPNLQNNNISFAFPGTTRDAMVDIAEKLGLAFFFCEEDNTNDSQVWYCLGSNSGGKANIQAYIHYLTLHAWKDFDSFYNSWIDPRYGLTFLNINHMLGEDGLDEQFDLTILTNAMNKNAGRDGDKANMTDEEKKKLSSPTVKMITNVVDDDFNLTPFYALTYNVVNYQSYITDDIGINGSDYFTMLNPGITDPNATQLQMNYSIPYNKTKLENGFYIIIGPGKNLSYKSGEEENGSYVKQSVRKQGGKIIDVMSDGEGDEIANSKSNMLASGNLNKFYFPAAEHNRRNLLQLEKQYVEMTLQGANLQIMRGEKIPALIIDLEYVNKLANDERQPGDILKNALHENMSGWFIIDGIKWIWDREPDSNASSGTLWKTYVKLIRREWPIPGASKMMDESIASKKNENDMPVNPAAGTLANAVNDNPENAQNQPTAAEPSDIVNNNLPTTGLREFMVDLYNAISTAANGNIELVSGRRWAIDESGNKVYGNSFIQQGGMYKCVNAKGDELWYESNNSKHLYGEAIDIINSGGMSWSDLLNNVLAKDPQVLRIMYDNGVSCYIEQSKDDMGTVSKHFHIGTDTTKQETWWNQVYKMNGESWSFGSNGKSYANYAANNSVKSAEITRQAVNL